jgi:hypothetical protein
MPKLSAQSKKPCLGASTRKETIQKNSTLLTEIGFFLPGRNINRNIVRKFVGNVDRKREGTFSSKKF